MRRPRLSQGLASRRAGLLAALACGAIAASLLAPFILRQNAWLEWANALWLLERQEGSIRALGHPSYFLQTEGTGAFYPQFLFYGGSLFAGAGVLAVAMGSAWAAYVAVLVVASASAFAGTLWLGRQAGLPTWMASLPALAVATSPYTVTLLYGRGAWAEIAAVGAIPLALAGACAIVRAERPWLGLAALAGAVATVCGSHGLTLVWGALVCGLIVVIAAWALGPQGRARVPRRRAAVAAGGLVLGGALVAWSLLPAAVYGRGTVAYADAAGFIDNATELDRLVVVLRPYLYAPPSVGDVSPANYYQLPVYVLAWAAVACLAAAVGGGARRVDRRLALGLWALLAALVTLLVANPIWEVLPGLLTAIQFPLRLHAYAVVVSGLLVIVALRMLRGRRRQAAWVAALAAALAVQTGFAQYAAWDAPVFLGREVVVPDVFPQGFGGYQASMYKRAPGGAIARPGAEIGLTGLMADRLQIDDVAPPAPRYGTGIVASDVVGVRAPWSIEGYDRTGFAVVRAPPQGQEAPLIVEPARPWPVALGTSLSLSALAICLVGGCALLGRRLYRIINGRARPA